MLNNGAEGLRRHHNPHEVSAPSFYQGLPETERARVQRFVDQVLMLSRVSGQQFGVMAVGSAVNTKDKSVPESIHLKVLNSAEDLAFRERATSIMTGMVADYLHDEGTDFTQEESLTFRVKEAGEIPLVISVSGSYELPIQEELLARRKGLESFAVLADVPPAYINPAIGE